MSAEQNNITVDLALSSLCIGIEDGRTFVVLSSFLAFSKDLIYAFTVYCIYTFVCTFSMHKATSLAFTFFLLVIPIPLWESDKLIKENKRGDKA
jgi:hypothetical protein